MIFMLKGTKWLEIRTRDGNFSLVSGESRYEEARITLVVVAGCGWEVVAKSSI